MPTQITVTTITAGGFTKSRDMAKVLASTAGGDEIEIVLPVTELDKLGQLVIQLASDADAKFGGDTASGFAPDSVEMEDTEHPQEFVLRFGMGVMSIPFLLDAGLLGELQSLAQEKLDTI